ncbi:hypothetical protein SpCBS45565_g04755 [Spizellomyces sp. 'palustris']|nr:hypothetical protein SpCBS45565_g04755 [Spizellomyces sp. 'palustris']
MNDFTLTSLLLLKGADPNAANRGGITPTIIAKRMGFHNLLKILKKHGGVIPSEEERVTTQVGTLKRKSSKLESSDAPKRLTAPSDRTGREPSTNADNARKGASHDPSLTLEQTCIDAQPNQGGCGQCNFPTYDLPVYNASYLGLAEDVISVAPLQSFTTSDANGCTPLMKASYKGHHSIVAAIIARNIDLNGADNQGHTALVWASLGGKLDVVRLLAEQRAVNIDGEVNHRPDRHPATPLVAAAFAGHTAIVEHLLDKGADINLKVGVGERRTAVMIAAWMRREEVVRLLVARGAQIERATDQWLKNGFIYLKRSALDYNAWTGSPGSFHRLTLSAGGSVNAAPQSRRMSLKEKVSYFSSEENQAMNMLELIMTGQGAKDSHVSKSDPNLATLHESVSDGQEIAAPKPRVQRGRARNRFRQGMNLDKLIGHNPEVIMELTERLPERGTELDAIWVQVFQVVIQLLMAANQNKKAGYILISAKAIHYAGEIGRAVEAIDKMPAPALKPSSTFGPAPSLPAQTTEHSLFAQSKIRIKIRELAKTVNNDLPKQLMLTTRIAIGVWPPQHAMSDMIKAATDLARTCRELTDVANMTGVFPVLDKTLEVNFDPYEDETLNANAVSESNKPVPAAGLTYEEYKRRNDLKVLEEISKQSTGRSRVSSSVENISLVEDRDAQFCSKLDDLLRQFVGSVKEIQSACSNHLKDLYVSLTSTAAHTAELLIDEIKGYELLSDFPEDLPFDQEDAKVLSAKGVNVGDNFPVAIADVWYAVLDEVRQTARIITMRGKLASGVMPPPNAGLEMLNSTIPCVIAVKKLVTISKECTAKIRRTTYEDRKKKDQLKKDVLQNEHVKNLFKLWESQVLLPQTEAAPAAEAELPSADDLEYLQDDLEGLQLDMSNNPPIVKGGKLTKLVEWMTSHTHYDKELVSAFILTHHSFTTSLELLEFLSKRYTINLPPALSRQQYDLFLRCKVLPVKQRVCGVIKYWMETHFEEDFSQCDLVVFKLRDFVESVITLDSEALAKDLMKMLDEKLSTTTSGAPVPIKPLLAPQAQVHQPPPPKLPRSFSTTSPEIYALLSSSSTGYLEFDPLEMARQLAILEFEHFRRIKAHECLDQIWGDRRKKEMVQMGCNIKSEGVRSGLTDIIKHTNVVTVWIANSIIRHENLKDRRDTLKYFAQMALHCRELCNFNGITAINAAMSMAPVHRLRKTWEAFKEKYPKIHEAYEEVAATVSPKGQYANYRRALKEVVPPAVPFLGVSLTDLTFTELGNPDFIPDTAFINFDKRRKVYHILASSIQKYQTTSYNLLPVPGMLEFFRDLSRSGAGKSGRAIGLVELSLMDEEELYEMSLKVEPREEELSDDDMADEGY